MTVNVINDTNETEIGSSPFENSPLWLNIAEISFLIPIWILVIVSSSIVLLVIFRTPKLHRTPGFLMIILSTVDILIALFDQGYSIYELGNTMFGFEVNKFAILCQFQFLANNFLYGVQSTTIMMAAVDRVMAITKPLYYHCHSIRLGKILFCVLFAYWLVLFLQFFFLWMEAAAFRWLVGFSSCMAQMDQRSLIRFMMSLHYSTAYIIPGGVILFCYAAIGLQIKRSSKERRKMVANMQNSSSQSSGLSKEQEVSHWQQIAICKSLILITVLYYISFLPFFLYQCVIYYSPHSLLYFSPIAYRALKAFRNLSSVTDGAIFYGMSNSFQVGLRSLVGRGKKQTSKQGVICGHTNRSTLVTSNGNLHQAPSTSGTAYRRNPPGIHLGPGGTGVGKGSRGTRTTHSPYTLETTVETSYATSHAGSMAESSFAGASSASQGSAGFKATTAVVDTGHFSGNGYLSTTSFT
ncbi:uncharacterized protein LOC142336011 [Convolutriloba macropyga]|uniref:uncharacterized protein LOC142336011 n=1 Tax=Convolutriloba macropyga TaxID=536237 RepID=UPI003F5234ED